MNTQRREEIRDLIAKLEAVFPPTDFEMLALSAINELFAHIDTLEQTAAERVIADGMARADRVLGAGGMVAVPMGLLDRLSLWFDWNRRHATEGLREEIDALRANQGGV